MATVLACVSSACATGDNTVTISGDVPGLDTIGLRGDSLLALADQSVRVIDSMKAAVRAELARTESPTVSESGDGRLTLPGDEGAGESREARDVRNAAIAASALSAGNAMSQRAQARGDSMARAIAQRLVGDGNTDRTRGDTLRGVLAFQGEEPARAVVLRVGSVMVSLSGMATSGLSRLVGTEVVVRGVKVTPGDIVVADYIVRAADGVPAYDGVLGEEGDLRMTDGSGIKRVPLPEALRGVKGARVWIAVKNGAPTAYGLVGRR